MFKKLCSILLLLCLIANLFSGINIYASDNDKHVSIRVEGINDTIVKTESNYTTRKSTVYDAVYEALSDKNIPVTVQESQFGKYISAIDNETAGTFGGYDGWLYAVNNVEGSTSIDSCSINDGDDIIVYYGGYSPQTYIPKVSLSADEIPAGSAFTVSLTATYLDWNTNTNVTVKISGASIKLLDQTCTTDENGKAVITAPTAEGDYSLEISKNRSNNYPLLVRTTQAIKVVDVPETLNLDKYKAALGDTITFTVYSSESANANSIFEVYFLDKNGSTFSSDRLWSPELNDYYSDTVYAYGILDGSGKGTTDFKIPTDINAEEYGFIVYFYGTGDSIPSDLKLTIKSHVNKSSLEALIAAANINKASATVSPDGSDVETANKWVSQEIMTAYETAITAAQGILNKDDAAQAEVDTAVTELDKATGIFNNAKKNGTKQAAYTVNFSAGENGTLTASVDGTVINSGSTVLKGKDLVFTASPSQNYKVKEWSVDGVVVPGNNTTTLTVSGIQAQKSVTVAFEQISHDIAYPVERQTIADALDKATSRLIEKFDDDGFNYQKHWMAIAINGFGKKVPGSYLNTINNGDMPAKNSGQYGKYILGILAAGGDPANINGRNLLAELCQLGDMKNVNTEGGIYTTPFGLLALDAVNYEIPADAGFTRDDIINKLITLASPTGGEDGVGFVLTALGKYYNEKPAVKTAVDKVVAAWSDRQGEDGGFGAGAWSAENNVNTAAQVLMGLSFSGINPQSEKFTKAKGNLVSFILSLQNEDGTFNWQKTNAGSISMATEQAAYALAQYLRQLDGKSNIYDFTLKAPDAAAPLIYTDLTDKTVNESAFKFTASANDASDGPIIPVVKLKGNIVEGTNGTYNVNLSEGSNTITISAADSSGNINEKSFTVVYTAKPQELPTGDKPITETPSGNNDSKKYVTVSVDKLTISKGYVISTVQVELQSNDTAWTLLKRELDKRGISCKYIWSEQYGSVYLQSIDGDGEFDHGSGSGWMYAVNSIYPNYGATKYILKDGDKLQWRYTTNLGADLGEDLTKWDNQSVKPSSGGQTVTSPENKTPASEGQAAASPDNKAPAEDIPKDIQKDYTYKDKGYISAWAYDAIASATKKGFVGGNNGSFNPKNSITRAEFIKIITSILGLDIKTGKVINFTDVKEGDWFYPYVNAAYKAGIVKGSGSRFNPGEKITREQMAAIIIRALGIKAVKPAAAIKDVNAVSDCFKTDVETIFALGLMVGNGTRFNPKDFATREMAVVVAMKAYNYKNEGYTENSSIKKYIGETGAVMQKTVPNPVVASVGGEWTVLSLARSGLSVPDSYFDKYYSNVEKKLKETSGKLHTVKYTEYDRVILALGSIGKDATNVSGYDLLKPLADFNTVVRQGLNGPVWALIALDSKDYQIPVDKGVAVQTTREMLIDYILSKEIKGGGWSLTSEAPADADITAMTLQALSGYRDNSKVEAAIGRALGYLSVTQQKDGSFKNTWGDEASSESIAQVIVALTSLNIDPKTDERFIKNGNDTITALLAFYAEGGGFKHILKGDPDAMATDQGMYALVSYDRLTKGQKKLYDMTDVKK